MLIISFNILLVVCAKHSSAEADFSDVVKEILIFMGVAQGNNP